MGQIPTEVWSRTLRETSMATPPAAGALYAEVTGCGTVYKSDTSGHETVLFSFSGPDGKAPFAGLIRDAAGNLYGTTIAGGSDGIWDRLQDQYQWA